MKTPTLYTKLLKEKQITKEILGEVLYSYNKRAKNYRDQARKHSNRYSKYDNYEKNKEKSKEYYDKKDIILSNFTPIEIHKQIFVNTKRIRFYDHEEEFHTIDKKRIINSGGYYDRDIDEDVEFIDILENIENIKYFLYYEVGGFDFHLPVDEDDLKIYDDLKIIDLKNFKTVGKDINELLSLQFCDKVFNLLKNNELEII